jgi:WD40 repeat protein
LDDLVITASFGNSKLRSWRKGDWLSAGAYACPGGVSAGAADPDGEMLAAGGRDGRLSVFSSDRREPEWSLPDAHRGRIDCVAFSPGGSYLASASAREGVVRLWSASSGEEVWRAEDRSFSLAFVGRSWLVTGGRIDSALRRTRDGRLVVKLGGAKLGGRGPVAASPDGRFVFTGGEDGAGTVWYVPALLAE